MEQIFCFSHAGGTASFYDELEKNLPDFEVVKLEYAGHGKRHKEPNYKNFQELTDDLYAQIRQKRNNESFYLFGYSMGGIAVVEILKKMTEFPEHIFIASCSPRTRADLAELSDENEINNWIVNRVIHHGAVPKDLEELFWRMYFPLYRQDYELIRQYRFEEIKREIPATIMYSESDISSEEIKGWESYFECRYHKFDGGHFFIKEHYDEVAYIVREIMESNEKIKKTNI